MQHDLSGLLFIHAEKPLEDVDHKFHGREVIIEQKHLEQWRPFEFWLGLFNCKVVVRAVRGGIRHVCLIRSRLNPVIWILPPSRLFTLPLITVIGAMLTGSCTLTVA